MDGSGTATQATPCTCTGAVWCALYLMVCTVPVRARSTAACRLSPAWWVGKARAASRPGLMSSRRGGGVARSGVQQQLQPSVDRLMPPTNHPPCVLACVLDCTPANRKPPVRRRLLPPRLACLSESLPSLPAPLTCPVLSAHRRPSERCTAARCTALHGTPETASRCWCWCCCWRADAREATKRSHAKLKEACPGAPPYARHSPSSSRSSTPSPARPNVNCPLSIPPSLHSPLPPVLPPAPAPPSPPRCVLPAACCLPR
ncbi:hypothetical protein BDV95DRAFT_200767 [Massariosphaeria phaeospora]|uniref:Uncharacterized protein n=1 Tax=Massariosphaeria phaeospora TaxID=100035 RepID=A0A7C8M278_9PLEO|nr:hypothetical protein BDV95DRAFT_200767 [Massariosphaeria phaeospora]